MFPRYTIPEPKPPSHEWFNRWGGIWVTSSEGMYTCEWYPDCPYDPSRSGVRIIGSGDNRESAMLVLYHGMMEYMWDQVTDEGQ